MALTKLNDDLNIIAKLDDEPNDVGNLTATELKAKFDEAGNAIQIYLNDTLVAELDAKFTQLAQKDTQLQEAINRLVEFALPDNSVGTAKLINLSVTHEKLALNAVEKANIKSGAVGETELAENAVSARTIVNKAVGEAKLADKSVSQRVLGIDAVWAGNIKAKEVKEAAFADKAVSTRAIADNAVGNTKLSTEVQQKLTEIGGKAPAYKFGTVDRVDGSPSSDPEGSIYWVVSSLG